MHYQNIIRKSCNKFSKNIAFICLKIYFLIIIINFHYNLHKLMKHAKYSCKRSSLTMTRDLNAFKISDEVKNKLDINFVFFNHPALCLTEIKENT